MSVKDKRVHYRAAESPLLAHCGHGRNWPLGALTLTSDSTQVTCPNCRPGR